MPDFNGNNKQGARDLMINRNVYNGYVLTLLDKVVEPTLETNQIKDFLKDEKILYGRLDHLIKNTIFPNSTFLRMFPGSTEQGLNLVVDAFDDMRRRFNEAYRTGQISHDSKAIFGSKFQVNEKVQMLLSTWVMMTLTVVNRIQSRLK